MTVEREGTSTATTESSTDSIEEQPVVINLRYVNGVQRHFVLVFPKFRMIDRIIRRKNKKLNPLSKGRFPETKKCCHIKSFAHVEKIMRSMQRKNNFKTWTPLTSMWKISSLVLNLM